MARIRGYTPSIPSVEVEAGAMGSTFEDALQAQGFTLGHFPSSIVCSTVGGWLAARSAGQCSSKYGKIEDMVLSMDVVLGTGELVRLHQRANGPSLCPLFVGSEGTLGVITSCELRLHPKPTRRAFGAFSFPSTQAGWEGMRMLLQAGLRPAVARLYDPFDARMAKAGRVKRKGEKSSARHTIEQLAVQALLRRPYGINALVHAAGDHVLGRALVLLIFEGVDDACDQDLATAKRLLGDRARFEGEGPARKWIEHRYSVSYRQAPVLSSGMFVDTMEVAATWRNLPALYEGVRNALSPHAFVMAHMSHAYADGCAIYFSFAGVGAADDGRSTDAACEARYDQAWRAALAAADEAGGVIAHHHGVGRSKAPRLRQEQGEGGIEAFQALKRTMDPHGILNPGNLVPVPSPDPYLPRTGAEPSRHT
jgi:alkyldihydroxyacetonephosphate synthase